MRVSSDPNGVYCVRCRACGRTLQLRAPPADTAVGAAVGQEGGANVEPGTVAGASLDAGASRVAVDSPTAESSTAPATQPAPEVGQGFLALARNMRELQANFDALVRDSRTREQQETGRRVRAEAEVDMLRGLLARHGIAIPGPR